MSGCFARSAFVRSSQISDPRLIERIAHFATCGDRAQGSMSETTSMRIVDDERIVMTRSLGGYERVISKRPSGRGQ